MGDPCFLERFFYFFYFDDRIAYSLVIPTLKAISEAIKIAPNLPENKIGILNDLESFDELLKYSESMQPAKRSLKSSIGYEPI